MLRDAWLVAAKDLQIEWRSRVTFSQVVPFAGLVLVLFGFALDANRPVLLQATSGLFWVTIMFVSTLAVQRSTSIETTDGARRALLLAGVEPPAVFVGKSIAVAVQLFAVVDDALGSVAVDGWSWLGLLAGFGVINVVLGALSYGVLLEET
ncbi:MAG: hypothetical protein EBY61_03480 [Actinobacteria bacterium]|nr:hypothetical protein [Actinomycetota bacterium]